MIKKIQDSGNMFPYEISNHIGPVKMVMMNKDSTLFASCCAQDKKIFVYDAFTFQILNVFITKSSVNHIQFTSDSKYLVGFCTMDNVYFFRIDDFTPTKLNQELPKDSKHRTSNFDAFKIKSGDLSYGTNKLLLVREELFKDKETYKINYLEVYDLKKYLKQDKSTHISSCNLFQMVNVPEDYVIKAAFGLDSNIIFYSTQTKMIIFNIEEKKIEVEVSSKNIQLSKINSMNFSSKYEFLALAGNEGVSILNPVDLSLVRKFTTEYPMNTVAISPRLSFKQNKKYHLIMGGGVSARDTAMSKEGGTEILLYNISTEEKMSELTGHYGPVNSLSWYCDGSGFVSAGEEGMVRVFRFDRSYYEKEVFK